MHARSMNDGGKRRIADEFDDAVNMTPKEIEGCTGNDPEK